MKFSRALIMFAIAAAAAACGSGTDRDRAGINSIANADPTVAVSPSPSPTAVIAHPTPSLSPLPPDASGVQAAIDVVREYYAAVNAQDYRKAYELWSGKGEASRQTFEEFRAGYLDTASVEADTSGEPGDLEGAAGSQYIKIPVRLTARTKDGKVQKFWGEYTLRRSMVDGASADQRAWRIYSAEVRKVD